MSSSRENKSNNQLSDNKNDLLKTLNQFQQEHCPEYPNLLSAFNDPSYFDFAQEEHDNNNETVRAYFLNLMQYLISLKEAMPQNKEALLYSTCRDILLNGIQLAQDIVTSKPVNRKKKILALSNAIQAATDFIKNQNAHSNCETLITTTAKMQREIEGPSLFRKENRFLCGFIGAVGALIGAALFVGGLLLEPISLGSSTAALVGGTLLFSISIGMLCHAIWPEADYTDARKNENKHSSKTAASLNALAGSSITLFSKKKESKEQPSLEFTTKLNLNLA